VTAIIQRALGEVKYDLKNNYRLQGWICFAFGLPELMKISRFYIPP
jgi:hypothetical protein